MFKLVSKVDRVARQAAMVVGCSMMAVLTASGVAWATDPIVLPDPGVDVEGHITAAITAMGAVVAVVVGGYFAFMIVRKGLQWARGALRG